MVMAADSTPLGFAIITGAAMLISAAAVWITAERAADGRLGPNRWAGVRTSATMASPEAWQEAHRVSLPWSRASAVFGVITGLLVLFVRSSPALTLAMLFGGLSLVVITILLGGIKGIRAARRVAPRDPS